MWFPWISYMGVGCPTNTYSLVRNLNWLLHTHFSASISSKHALDDQSWCVFGVVFGVVGCHLCSASPFDLGMFFGKCLLLVCAFFCFFYGWVLWWDSHWNLHMPTPMWNMHGFYRWGPWCASPKLFQTCAPPNLPCPSPLPKAGKSCLSMVGGSVCTNRCRLGRGFAS